MSPRSRLGTAARREAREPWGIVVAGLAGGLAFAVAPVAAPVALGLGVGVAGAVYGTKVLAGLFSGGAAEAELTTTEDGLLPPPQGSAAGYWLVRAEAAVRDLRALAADAAGPSGSGPVPGASDVGVEAAQTLAVLRRLASTVTVVDQALSRIDGESLAREADRVAGQQRAAPAGGELRAELDRTAASLADQQAVAARLVATRDAQLARLQAAAVGLDGLVARLAELLALAPSTGAVDQVPAAITSLAGELDGLREGLVASDRLSRELLGDGSPPSA